MGRSETPEETRARKSAEYRRRAGERRPYVRASGLTPEELIEHKESFNHASYARKREKRLAAEKAVDES